MRRYLCTDSDVSYYHIIIKVPDNTYGNRSFAFEAYHKEKLRRLFFWLEDIYCLECVNYCIMSTHAHFIIAWRPEALNGLSLKEAASRHQRYKGFQSPVDARSKAVREFRERLNNISDFMGNIEKRFTRWYNRQFDELRRGQLWNHNFRSVHLKNTSVLIHCLQYIELNPVRAKIVDNPEDYEFSSWADICKNNLRAEKLKSGIIKAIRSMGACQEDDRAVFRRYAEALLMITESIKLYGDVRSLKKNLVMELLQNHPYWSHGKSLSIEGEYLCIETERRKRFIHLSSA